VGVAAGEQNRDEMKGLQQALGGPIMEVCWSFMIKENIFEKRQYVRECCNVLTLTEKNLSKIPFIFQFA
jgi:hypothetical protein